MPMQPARQRLYDLQVRREDIVAMIIAEQDRLTTANDPFICRDLKASIRYLTHRRDALQKQIDAHIETNRQLAAQYRQLQSAPGIGPQVACRLMASMPDSVTLIAGRLRVWRDWRRMHDRARCLEILCALVHPLYNLADDIVGHVSIGEEKVLATLIEVYEEKRHLMDPPDPIGLD